MNSKLNYANTKTIRYILMNKDIFTFMHFSRLFIISNLVKVTTTTFILILAVLASTVKNAFPKAWRYVLFIYQNAPWNCRNLPWNINSLVVKAVCLFGCRSFIWGNSVSASRPRQLKSVPLFMLPCFFRSTFSNTAVQYSHVSLTIFDIIIGPAAVLVHSCKYCFENSN